MEHPAEEMVDWIDPEGRTLAALPRSEIRRRNLLHRVSSTLVFHPDGRLFVQRRTATKDVYPSLYDMSVGGTVASGEGFEQNACREIKEELGVSGVPIHPLFAHRFQDHVTHNLIQVFACVYDGPLRLQPEEVAEGAWCAEAEVMALVQRGDVCPDSCQGWRLYLERHGSGRNFAQQIAPTLAQIQCGALV